MNGEKQFITQLSFALDCANKKIQNCETAFETFLTGMSHHLHDVSEQRSFGSPFPNISSLKDRCNMSQKGRRLWCSPFWPSHVMGMPGWCVAKEALPLGVHFVHLPLHPLFWLPRGTLGIVPTSFHLLLWGRRQHQLQRTLSKEPPVVCPTVSWLHKSVSLLQCVRVSSS